MPFPHSLLGYRPLNEMIKWTIMKSRRSRLIAAIATSTIAGLFAGFIHHVTLGEPPMEMATHLIPTGGIIGVLLQGRIYCECRWYAVPFLILSVVQMFSIYLCLSSGWIFFLKLIIPFAVVIVPFAVMYRIISSRLETTETDF